MKGVPPYPVLLLSDVVEQTHIVSVPAQQTSQTLVKLKNLSID
jgi:hypothetical protein